MRTALEHLDKRLTENEIWIFNMMPKLKVKLVNAMINYAAEAIYEASETADIDCDGMVDKQSILKNIDHLQ